MRVFLYGSLMDPAVFARCTGTAEPVLAARAAQLHGWRRVALRGAVFPTLVAAPSSTVNGLLAEVPPSLLPALHAYEGPLYRFLRVRVFCGGTRLAARAWAARPDRADAAREWTTG